MKAFEDTITSMKDIQKISKGQLRKVGLGHDESYEKNQYHTYSMNMINTEKTYFFNDNSSSHNQQRNTDVGTY